MFGDRRLTGIRQTQFTQTNSPVVDRQVVRRGEWQEAAQDSEHLVAGQFRGARAAHKISTAAQNTDGKAIKVRLAQQTFLGGAAGPA